MSDNPNPTVPPALTPGAARAALDALPKPEQDDDGVVFLFGTEKVKVPPLNFFILKNCWDEINAVSMTSDVVARVDGVLNIVSRAMNEVEGGEKYTNEYLAKRLRATQWPHLTASYAALLVLSGLLNPDFADAVQEAPGEPQGGGSEGSSTPSSNGFGGNSDSNPQQYNASAGGENDPILMH